MSTRPAPARLHSLCGTGRKLKVKNPKKLVVVRGGPARLPCRPSGIWACIHVGERSRRPANAAR